VNLEDALREAGDGYVRRASWAYSEPSMRRARTARGLAMPGVFEDAYGVKVSYDNEALAADDWVIASGKEHDIVGARRALRRLQDQPATIFEQVIDLLYELHSHSPEGTQATDLMRRLLGKNHNFRDADAVRALKGLVEEARKDKISMTVSKLGLDEVERLLGIRSDE